MSETCPVIRIVSSHPESQGPFVEINESDFNAEMHEKFVDPAPPPPPPPIDAPPPPPPGPLDNLPAEWRSQDVGELKKLAAAIGGRSVENKGQAIQVIEAALKARDTK